MTAYDEVEELKTKMNKCTDPDEINAIRIQIQEKAKNACELIKQLKAKRIELDQNLNGKNEQHSREENAKAIRSHQNRRGKLFAKNVNLKDAAEFTEKASVLSRKLQDALDAGDDLAALEAFGNNEIFEYENTQTKKTWMGELETGYAGWRPLPEKLDFSPDPLLRYAVTVATEITIVSNIIGNINNYFVEQAKNKGNALNAAEQQRVDGIDQANIGRSARNGVKQGEINQHGSTLEGNTDSYSEGMEQIGYSNPATVRAYDEYGNEIEYGDWGAAHTAADNASHLKFAQRSSAFESEVNRLNQLKNSGQLTNVQYLQGMQSAISQASSGMVSDMGHCIQQLRGQMSTYDYTATMNWYNNLVNNPSAIDHMVDGLVESVGIGEKLSKTVIESYQPVQAMIQQIPGTVRPLFGSMIVGTIAVGVMNKQNNQAMELQNACGSKMESKMEEVSKRKKEREEGKRRQEEAQNDLEEMMNDTDSITNDNDNSFTR